MRSALQATMLAAAVAAAPAVQADESDDSKNATYHVTITNLTRGESFTPFLVVSHRPADHLMFTPGGAPSAELAALAEGGDTAPLQGVLSADPRVHDTNTGTGLLDPGHSVTIEIQARPGADRLSLAAMLVPTNDGFVSLQNVALPRGHHDRSLVAPAYDAGSEPNDELCVSIPGPVCGGAGGSPEAGGEGFVHIHSGIHGIGDLFANMRDWHNPVAIVHIQRVRDNEEE